MAMRENRSIVRAAMRSLQGFTFAVVLAFVEAAPALAERRPVATLVAKQAPRTTAEELPLPAVPTVEDVLALYTAVGRDLKLLAERDLEASNELMPRYRYIRVLDAVRDFKHRRRTARQLVELRHLIAAHAN
jgi:hypothetical protein